MARTYEAMMKAEEEARKRQATRELPSSVDHGPSSEEYHRLKLNLLRMSPDAKIKTLLFSSPTGGEGTSTVLAGFAVALADQGEKVLLVDANFGSPSLHERFGIEIENGLSDLLSNKGALKDVIKSTSVQNLFVITAGRVNGSGSSYVSEVSAHGLNYDELLSRMKSEADWVFVDGPALNHSDKGLTLSGKVDGVIMVLQAEKTRWEVAQAAKQRLEESGAKILGVILNKRKFYIPKWLYKTL